jgi:nitrate reductase NapE component
MSRLFGRVLLLWPVASIRIVALYSFVVALLWLMLFLCKGRRVGSH